MSYEIDQSGKVEDTARKTVIAYSNSTQSSIVIPASSKRRLQELYRKSGEPRMYVYQIFALGVFFLIRPFRQTQAMTIDMEYPGKDKVILHIIKTLLAVHGKPEHVIRFARIGSHPNAHYAAKNVLDGKVKPREVVTDAMMLDLIKKADGRLRACLSTLVGDQPRSFRSHYTKPKRIVKRRHKK